METEEKGVANNCGAQEGLGKEGTAVPRIWRGYGAWRASTTDLLSTTRAHWCVVTTPR